MTDLDAWYQARELLRTALENDLQGGPADDRLTEPPLDRFIVGILHPQDAADPEENGDQDETDDAGARGDDASFDPAIAMTRRRYPSSMGLTCSVKPEQTPRLVVAVTAWRYDEVAGGLQTATPEPDVRHRDGGHHQAGVWERTSVEVGEQFVDVTTVGPGQVTLAEGLDLRWIIRSPVNGSAAVTVVLVNTHKAPRGSRDALCWFRPRLVLTCETGRFVERPNTSPAGLEDDDVKSSALLFRDVRNLGVGHGCAVAWPQAESVTELQTTFIPREDVPLSEASGDGTDGYRMRELAADDDLTGLGALLDRYDAWITSQSEEITALPDELQETARRHMRAAQVASTRMRAGLNLLEEGSPALRAFRLMNDAMAEQRARQDLLRAGPGAVLGDGAGQAWRPFQIAFILLNLEGLTDPEADDRQLADLLWFPTGGGKTEAYLGLIAYTILLRRLRNPADGGVSVLMRYTLRLLTLQQFERAAGLICALELIRRRELPDAAPISIGLWVGQSSTPNTVDDARKALSDLARKLSVEEKNPVQLLRCPWCGVDLKHSDYRVPPDRSRMTIHCPNGGCTFTGGLPVHLVDEDVYRERPSLVIATVDKFAMIAWRAEAGALFSTDGRNPPPDLIIQDELHLISGPLGTMVGLYETAIDAASSRPHRPKLVASTATIRRAARQMAAVFDREAHQFPPPGLTADNSFFARPASPTEKGTRQYVGVLAPGTSQTTLLVRTYAALLQAAKALPADDQVRDAYWTLLGYFNSLRVLGGAYMQVIDDVPDRLKVVAERLDLEQRKIREPREMTSRRKSSEIPHELKLLGTSYPDPESPDVVLATNMISVGVDVDRLGLMAVMGQPQATAEYIQATSRVGRKYPGLVVTMYNGARSRDLSHYESFTNYHRSLYRQVEATGATPFAARARDRGLHGVLVGMARLLIPAAAPDKAAGDIDSWENELHEQARLITERAGRVTGEEQDPVARQLADLIDRWVEAADQRRTKYAGWFDHRDTLLADAGAAAKGDDVTFPADEAPWPTLTSLRDVDAESSLYLVRSRRRPR